VQGAGKHAFTRAAFPEEKKGRGGGRGFRRRFKKLLHQRLLGIEIGQGLAARQHRFKFHHPVLETLVILYPGQRLPDLFRRERLGNVIDRPCRIASTAVSMEE